MFTLDKKGLFNLPRIALVHGDGEHATWKDPIKRSFEIPETMFADVHASRVKADFLDKRSQFLLCIISPSSSATTGVDLGAFADLWLDYLNQGSFLLVFDADVAWLGRLGQRFSVSPRENGALPGGRIRARRICLESRLLANQGVAEGVETLGPWLGEYASWDPCWEPLIESEQGGALALAQSFGMSKVILFSGLLSKDNLIKIVPVRMIIASALQTWFRETSVSAFDARAGIHCSIALNRKVHASFLPLECRIDVGSLGSKVLTGALEVDVQIRKGGAAVYTVHDATSELGGVANWAKNLVIDLSTIDGHPIDDGEYVLKGSIQLINGSGVSIHFSEEIDFEVCTRELSEIWSTLIDLKRVTTREVREAGKRLDRRAAGATPGADLDVLDDASMAMRLVYMHSRIGIALEVLENLLGSAVDPDASLKVSGKITKPIHVNIGTIAELRRLYEECCTRAAALLPQFKALPVPNPRYKLLQVMASGPGSGCVWECKPVSGASSIIPGFGDKKPEETLAAFHNGFCVARATCITEGKKEKLQKHLEAFKKQHPAHEDVSDLGLVLASSGAFPNVSWHGFLPRGDFAIRIDAFSRQAIVTIARHAVSSTPITSAQVTAMAADAWNGLVPGKGLDLDTLVSHLKDSVLVLPKTGLSDERALMPVINELGVSAACFGSPSPDQTSKKTTRLHLDDGKACHAELEVDNGHRELQIHFGRGLGMDVCEAVRFLTLLRKYLDGELTYFTGDLHSHSTLSDGMFNPEDVGIAAFNCFMDFFGLTDHHTTAGANYLCNAAKARGWEGLFVPGCQEVTQVNAHYIAVCAKKTVLELVEPEGIIAEFERAGAGLKIFAHPRQPHPWNDLAIRRGSKSGFDSFVGRGEFLAHREAFVKEGTEPAWTESTDADDACFGSFQRTVVLVDTSTSKAASICDIVCNAIKQKLCFGTAGSGMYGTPPVELFARILPMLEVTSKTYKERFVKRVRSFLRGV